MRILHVIDDLTMGGGQNLLISLAGSQVECGNDVTVLQLKRSPDLTIANKMERLGVKVSWLTSSGSLYNPFLIFRLVPWIRKYDIVHVHLFPALYWAGFANLLCFCKIPLVYTEHSTTNRRRSNKLLKRVDSFIYRYCYKIVVACADKALNTFCRSYPKVRHIVAINNGVDYRVFSDAKPYSKEKLLGVPEDSFIVMMVARFLFMKRQDIVVRALSCLPHRFHACFIGGESTDEGLIRIKDLAISLGIEDRVHFLYIRSDVPRLLKTSDAVVMSSEYEGLSLSSLEGMAAGRPFIASDVDGLREVVDGAGVLFQLEEYKVLADIILKLDSDDHYYKEIAGRCMMRAKEYDLPNMVDKYTRVYYQVLSWI